ncbi:DUF2066 domain-containing protein [Kordiimonas marina]|uniref:DUF2066 domain-containing protein n=1 Tax=Kordiimonas marina TaxID=2872312 RepID=UPI001FF5CFF8
MVFALLILLPAALGMLPARADDAPVPGEDPLDRLFTIQDVHVDETATSAALARQVALKKAENIAYNKLLGKLTQAEGRAKLPELSETEREALVSGIEVVDEQSSSRRYIATLNIRFEPQRVSAYFAQYHVPHVLGTGGGILVLHAHARGLSHFLWEEDPAMAAGRKAVDWVNRIRHYVFPYGDVRERLAISYEEVKDFDTDAARKMAARYQVQAALMIFSRYEDGVLHYRFHSTEGDFSGEGDITGAADESAALTAMYERVLDANDSAWRAQLLVDTSTGGEMTVLVPTRSLADLNTVEAKLKSVALIEGYSIDELSLPLSRIHLRYNGREDQLTMALRYAGLSLVPYGEDRLLEPHAALTDK